MITRYVFVAQEYLYTLIFQYYEKFHPVAIWCSSEVTVQYLQMRPITTKSSLKAQNRFATCFVMLCYVVCRGVFGFVDIVPVSDSGSGLVV